jgi:hypothetical protein
LATGCIQHGTGYIDGTALKTTGQYSVTVDPEVRRTGEATINVIRATDQNSTLSIGGPAATASILASGATSTFQFAGAAGDKVFIDVPTSTLPDECGILSLRDPDGHLLATGCIQHGTGHIEATALTATGTFTIAVDPDGHTLGTAQVRLLRR